MGSESESELDHLWHEYSAVFRDFDDLTLARWMAQTLGQMEGRVWRLSHPLLAAYRLAAQVGHEKQIWLKRLASAPAAYAEAPCCRAPLLPLLTRDVREAGLVCQHCGGSAVVWEDITSTLRPPIQTWSNDYAAAHAVAHWDDRQRKAARDYERAYEDAAATSEKLLREAGRELMPKLAEFYPAVAWEDQDECLGVRPEDIEL